MNSEPEIQQSEPSNAARQILGDASPEDAAKNVQEDLQLITNPADATLGGKPRKRRAQPQQEPDEPTKAQIMFGEACVKTQAISVSGFAALFADADSATEMYRLHVETHRAELALAYAKVAKEFGYEVTGKVAALLILGSAEVDVIRDCWKAFVPKEKPEEG